LCECEFSVERGAVITCKADKIILRTAKIEKGIKRMTNQLLSHERSEDTIEAKTRWFRSLPLSERMEIFCEFTELALSLNPKLFGMKNAPQIKRRIQIVSAA